VDAASDTVGALVSCACVFEGVVVNELEHSLNSSSSVMEPFFANQSCDPFTAQSTPCQLGNYVSYAVNVSCVADVQAALSFARDNNIRIVVRNTGHEYVQPFPLQ
jgi:hypothetical protein